MKAPLVERVRAVIPKCRPNFTVRDVMAQIGAESSSTYTGVAYALNTLVALGQLDTRIVHRRRDGGGARHVSVFWMSPAFNPERADPVAQREAGEFLQKLALEWGASRPRHLGEGRATD